MSTDHQRYSTANQSAALQAYAESHALEIVRTYADEGRSGLRIQGRPGLKRLIAEVESGEADFDTLLVYDVSRWGRFQDADESAYYEFLCRRAGVNVVYCAEPFENDGTPFAAIVKSVKRAMAGEFSRELSVKVRAGQVRLVGLGFKQGGPAPFGYRRQLVGPDGARKGVLAYHEKKSLQDDHVRLEPGPRREVEAVREIFDLFVNRRFNPTSIAVQLNERGLPRADGRRWSRSMVQTILSNEAYIGNLVFGRTAFPLKQRKVATSPFDWERCTGCHAAIVEEPLFRRAQHLLAEQVRRRTDGQLLIDLRELLEKQGRLTGRLVDEQPDLARADTYAQRFGSLAAAFDLVGYKPHRGGTPGRRFMYTHSKRTALVVAALEGFHARGALVEDLLHGVFRINREFTVSLSAARSSEIAPDRLRWLARFRPDRPVDIRVVTRLAPVGDGILDVFIVPTAEYGHARFSIAEHPRPPLSFYRFDSLDPLFQMVERVRGGDDAR
jgi:DNA invertase Pin-like site-specific DNA recombinase